MATTNLLQAVGLQTFNNNLDLPPGSLLQAKNINIDRNGVMESRRGFKQWQTVGTDASMYAYQLIAYKGRILAHYPYTTGIPANPISGKLAFDDNAGHFVDFTQDVREVETGVRIKSVEMNGNLYFTSSTGIKKISAKTANDLSTINITDTNAVRALDIELGIDTSGAGFLPANYQVGYRLVWGINDANGNLILGYPSPLNVISNLGSQEVSVKVSFYIPNEINTNTNYFYQIYRTQPYTIDTPPSDELKLIYEGFNNKIDNWVTDHYEIVDQYTETLRQANTNLYTNQYSGEGIAYGNLKPPIAKDITTYKNHVFYSNIKTNQQLTNTLLGVGNFDFLNVVSITSDGSGKKIIQTSGTQSLTNGDRICLRGTGSLDRVYTISDVNNVANTFKIPEINISNSTILGGAVVYLSNLSITKNATTNYYWAVGRQQIDEITFNTDLKNQISTFTFGSNTKTDYADEAIVLHSARNETSYAIWFDTTGTSSQPTQVASYNKVIKINLFAASLTTKEAIVDSIRQQLLLLDIISDFTIELTSTGGELKFTTTKKATATASSIIATITPPPGSYNITVVNTAGVGAEVYADQEITIYSAENKVKYIIWFDPTGSGTSVTNDLTAAYVKIDLSSNELTTKEDICSAFVEQLNYNVFDFIANVDETLFKKAVVKTSSSGTTVQPTVVTPIGADIVVTNIQMGIGLVNNFSETTNDKQFLLSTNLSSSIANEETIKSFLNAINKNSNEVAYGYYTSIASGLPGEFTLESRLQDDIFFKLNSNTPDIKTLSFNEILPQDSASESLPNRLFFSKQSQPDSVPLVNYFDVGPRDKEIKRIIGLRDSLFIFKEEGIYRLFGNISANFQVVLFDSSSNITATDSAVVLNNQIYVLTSQGVARVSETGVNIISRPIENLFTKVMNIPYYQWISYGISYEADRSYLLFTPSESDDTTATIAFRFNTFTETWTTWERNYNCGVVHPAENKLYFGAVEDNYIEVERKTLTRTDYADRIISGKTIVAKISDTKITLSGNQNLDIGDSLVQTQTVTISQINRLINKIKNDSYLNPTNSIVLTEAVPFNNLALKLKEITAVLNVADTSLFTQGAASVLNHNPIINMPGHQFQTGDYVTIGTSTVPNILTNLIYKIVVYDANHVFLQDENGHTITPSMSFPFGVLTNIKEIYYASGLNTFSLLQNEFNGIVTRLNASPSAFYTNYQLSEGTVEIEAHIKTFNAYNTQITIDNPNAFIIGACDTHKGINVVAIYAPQHFGDPSIWKHVRESKIMFEADNFEGAYLGFNTDITNDFEEIAFSMEGNGSWGGVPWGDFTWGGEGLQVPFRTLIPRQKQRCRFIKARFRHVNSRNKFAIYGISFVFEGGTERTNK